jgi:hypothetical protein
MKTLIIQTSPCHTASTLLINALYGLIPELTDKKIIMFTNNFEKYFDDIILLKHHDINIDKLIEKFKNDYKLYFICSERPERNYIIDEKYKSYENVRIFSFNELNESETNNVRNIVENIYNKIKDMLNIEMNIDNGIKRIEDMNKVYQEIKDKPFNYIDNFYEIHGSHRNRTNMC